jgi:Pyruvate/2-oxoacid:ferredoxin oxidoreductase gamma subunit
MDYDKLEGVIARIFMRKGEVVIEMNKKALRIGREAGENQLTVNSQQYPLCHIE